MAGEGKADSSTQIAPPVLASLRPAPRPSQHFPPAPPAPLLPVGEGRFGQAGQSFPLQLQPSSAPSSHPPTMVCSF